MSKAKTPLLAFLQKAYHLALQSKQPGAPPTEEIIEEAKQKALSRRKFMENSGKAALFTGLGGSLLAGCQKEPLMSSFIGNESDDENATEPKMSKTGARIAIIGGGMAGLHALHILKQAGVQDVKVYEANNRAGGRIMTAQNVMAAGLSTEYGGEFIDSGHEDMLALASEFGLSLIDTQAPSEQALIKDAYYFNGQHYTLTQVVEAFSAIVEQIADDADSLSNKITYENYTTADQCLDNTSISAYLCGLTGIAPWLEELLNIAYETEYGLSTDQQSSINLLYLIGTDPGSFEIFGVSDERYKIAGGNQQIPDAIANLYPGAIKLNKKLTAIDKEDGEYILHLTGYNEPKVVDYVIMTLPFTVLRNINIMFSLPAWKTNAINNLGYGTNAKLMLGYNSRPWRNISPQGYAGYVFSDNGVQTGWDNSQLQVGTAGGFTVYLGGTSGVQLGNGTPQSRAAIYLPKVNQIFPGSSAQHNGNVQRMHWPSFQYALGSYACYKVGQWTTIAGAEKKKVGKMYFAGEHCSFNYQGYMNGAAEMGRKAAEKIIENLE